MIGKLMPHTTSFRPRTQYALLGRDYMQQRTPWLVMRNLHGVEPEFAHLVMQATAGQSKRVKKPCGHLIVSWPEGEALAPQTTAEILDRTMEQLGLAEHQAVYFPHDDTANPHVHVIYNRIHPDTGKAAKDSFSRLKLRRTLMAMEQEYGLQQTPYLSQTRALQPELRELQIAQREERDALLRFPKRRCDELREDLAYAFTSAGSWSRLDELLGRRGFRLHASGGGVRVVKQLHYAKLSDVIPPKLKVKRLTQRFGNFSDYWREKTKPHQKQRQKRRQRQLQR